MTNKTIYLPGLNGLRAIAAISVLISHIFFETFGNWGIKGLNLPIFTDGVTLFFVISGFLITYLLLYEIKSTNVDFSKFGFNLFENIEIDLKSYWFDDYINENLNTDNIKKYSKLDIWDKDTKTVERSLKTLFVHWYLHKTTNLKSNILIRILDKILIKIGI